jgi:long-subunit fatty acid transport protein
MGGAFLARADDATAASWNPAGLSYLRQPEMSIVWAGSKARRLETLPTGVRGEEDTGNGSDLDFLSVAFPFEIGSTKGATQINFQRVAAFRDRTIVRTRSSSTEPLTTKNIDSQGGLDVLAIGSGWQISRGLRFGVAANWWFQGYRQTLRRTPAPTEQRVDFDLTGWNAHLGAIWTPLSSLNLGAVLKTGFKGDVELRRSRWDMAEGDPETRTANAASRSDVVFDVPPAVGFGGSWRPRSPLTVSLDYTRTFWSKGRIHNYFTLPKTDVGEPAPIPENDATEINVFDVLPYPRLQDPQKDTEQIRVGAEYVIVGQRVKWPLRVGYYSDRTYFVDAYQQAPRLHGFTGGGGIGIGPAMLDVAYVYEVGRYWNLGDANERIRVDLRTHRFFVSLIYRHRTR